MGFNSVYRALQEVFPGVDSRVLRAVAIEHSKDADAAVEVVLVEVLPYLSKQPTAARSTSKSGSLPSTSKDADAPPQPIAATPKDPVNLNGSLCYADNAENRSVCENERRDELLDLDKSENTSETFPDTPFASVHGASDDHDQRLGNSVGKEDALPGKSESIRNEARPALGSVQSFHLSHSVNCEENGAKENADDNQFADWTEFQHSAPLIQHTNHQEQSMLNAFSSEIPVVQECLPSVSEIASNLLSPGMLITDLEWPKVGSSFGESLKKDTSDGEIISVEVEAPNSNMSTRPGPTCSIEFLEDLIEDARNRKKTLVSSMESVVSLMKEVESYEKAAEQAKEETAKASLDVLAKLDELKNKIRRTQEANEIFAGEVYAERAILATEVKELQFRLVTLSDERDKSLGILDEMRETLEVRLAAAKRAMVDANLEKVENGALAHPKHIMEELIQESKLLKQEAEENSKLHEFLTDRGRLVDVLQGEISVKCQDVKLLKERFDRRLPLSKSLSSSQLISTSASSSLSSRSGTPPEQAYELTGSHGTLEKNKELAISYEILSAKNEDLVESSENMNKTSSTVLNEELPEPFEDATPNGDQVDQISSDEVKARGSSEVPLEQGWEFFNFNDSDEDLFSICNRSIRP